MNDPVQSGLQELGQQADGHELLARLDELETQNEELRQAQRELEKSRKTYVDLYDFAPVGYVSLDKDGTIVFANLAASDMLRLSREELTGRGFSQFVHPADQGHYFGLVNDAADTEGGKHAAEIRLLAGKTGTFHARVELRGSTDVSGGLTGLRIAFVDISEQKNGEERLKRYAEKLERSNQELQDFAFIASHDLSEPLRKIQAFGDRLQRKFAPTLGGEGLEYVERMRGATKRLQDMIGGLLEYSRVVTAGTGFVPVDLDQLVRDVLSDLEWQVEKNGATITLDRLPTLEADPHQIRRLFQNLISNALKFHGKDPSMIKIFSRPHGDRDNEVEYLQIIVEDNGIGFEEIHAERIFSLFERLHSRRAYEGTGMGLAICRRIVERHGGFVTANGVPGKGATFIITLPVKSPCMGESE